MRKLKSILLINDDPIANFLNESIIKEMGASEIINAVENGQEGLDYLKNNAPPELIFLDLNMPVLNGFDFLEYYNDLLINRKEDIKIIILSSSKREDDKRQAMNLGAADYLVKPVTEEKIKEIIIEHF